ncbi:MAG: hypothetical protein ACLUIQ_09135 [Dialister invisus]
MVGKDRMQQTPEELDFCFRSLSILSYEDKSHVCLLGRDSKTKNPIRSAVSDTLMMTDYKGHVIKMSSDMANEKIQEPT